MIVPIVIYDRSPKTLVNFHVESYRWRWEDWMGASQARCSSSSYRELSFARELGDMTSPKKWSSSDAWGCSGLYR